MVNYYQQGRRGEHLVAQLLRRAGADVTLNPGSRGAEDIIADFPYGRRWLIQVKSSETGQPATLSSLEKHRLNTKAAMHGATPVLAQVYPNGEVVFFCTRTGRRLYP